jgi:hypothetical protein
MQSDRCCGPINIGTSPTIAELDKGRLTLYYCDMLRPEGGANPGGPEEIFSYQGFRRLLL